MALGSGRQGRRKGTPKTGGRKKGTPNKRTAALKALLESKISDDWLIDRLKTFAAKGDAYCLRELCERKWGRVPQAVQPASENGKPGGRLMLLLVDGKEPVV